MYAYFDGRIMNAEKANEIWRKTIKDPAESKLRKLVIHLLRRKTI